MGAPYHVYVAAALFGAAALAFLALNLDAYRAERKLLIWGVLAPGMILRERDYLSRFGRRAGDVSVHRRGGTRGAGRRCGPAVALRSKRAGDGRTREPARGADGAV